MTRMDDEFDRIHAQIKANHTSMWQDRLLIEIGPILLELLSRPDVRREVLVYGMVYGVRAAWEHPATALFWLEAAGSAEQLFRLSEGRYGKGNYRAGLFHAYGMEDPGFGEPPFEAGRRIPGALTYVLEWLREDPGAGKRIEQFDLP